MLVQLLMGLEPTTFCMAISSSMPDFQHRCGFLARTDAVGLPSITGVPTVIRQSDGSPAPASECVSTRSLDGAKRARGPYRTWRSQVVRSGSLGDPRADARTHA